MEEERSSKNLGNLKDDQTTFIDSKGEKSETTVKVKGSKRKKQEIVEILDDGVPYDRGWAWMIVLSGFLNFVIAAGYNRGTFIFFVHFLEEFRAPVTETALLFGVKAGVNSIVGLFVMNAAVGRFGVRKTVLVGAFCLAASAILGSFATDVTSLILFQSIFHGLGIAMLNMPTTVLLGFYFRRRRSLANSVTKCGVGVGAVAFPPIVTALLDEFGLRGSLLIMGGVCLNAVVAASLLRPVSFYKKVNDSSTQLLKDDNKETGECVEDELNERTCANLSSSDPMPTELEFSRKENGTQKVSNNFQATQAPGIQNGGREDHQILIEGDELLPLRNGYAAKKTLLSGWSSDKDAELSKSSPDLHLQKYEGENVVTRARTRSFNAATNLQRPSSTCLSWTCDVARRACSVLDFRLLHSPFFRLLVVFFILSNMAHTVNVYLPAMAKERGIDEHRTALMLSIIGALDFCCRLACGFIADLKIIRVSTMISIAFSVVGVVCQFVPLLTTFPLLMILAVTQGCLASVSACLMPILIMEDIGLENTAKALGFFKLFGGAAMAGFHPLLGYIRDTTGSYDIAYHVMGACILVAAAIMMCLRFVPHTFPTDNQEVRPPEEECSPLNTFTRESTEDKTNRIAS